MAFSTLTQGLDAVCESDGRVCFLNSGNEHTAVAFAELRRRALGLLTHFQGRGIETGDELIISTNNNLAFIDAFWACQYGGIIPVPIAPGISEQQRHKLFRVYRQLRNPFLYTDHQTGGRIRALADRLGIDAEYQGLKRRTILTENVTDLSQPARPAPIERDQISFIQYSSGSTGDPKGVLLTHRNLTTNIQDIHTATNLLQNDVSLSWMPLTHDMGLIGFHLAMLLGGATHHIMATDMFVRRPLSWLQAASEHKATLLCSPNFGYRLFLKAFARWQIDDLELSRVRLLFNGAEPISAAVCDEFMAALAPYGLKRTAMTPVYGLAEASLAVSLPDTSAPYQTVCVRRNSIGLADPIIESTGTDAIRIVGVGQPVKNCSVRITDSQGGPAMDGRVGRIEIRGPNVTQGYFALSAPDRSAHTEDGWLDTGDLGFFHCGSLYIAGRLKDVMFVNGQNYHAHDLEEIVTAGLELNPGNVVVSAITNPGEASESVVVFVLHFGDLADFGSIAAGVRHALSVHAGVEVSEVVPVEQITRTTSGKIQRYALRSAYMDGAFDRVMAKLNSRPAALAPATGAHSNLESVLLEICASSLDGITLERDDNFFKIGMNSLKLIEIHELIDQHFPSQLEISDMFDHPTLAQLAAFLQTKLDRESPRHSADSIL